MKEKEKRRQDCHIPLSRFPTTKITHISENDILELNINIF